MAQLVECLPSMHPGPGSHPQHCMMGVMLQVPIITALGRWGQEDQKLSHS